jgi:E3 ubiquitin-protein ligase DOA10
MESIDWDRIGLRTQQAVEKAMDRMQIDVERVAEKAARQQERLERHAQKEAHRRKRQEQKHHRTAEGESMSEGNGEVVDWPEDPAGQPAAPEYDLEQERLSILRMVEQGQIAPQEAELLLDALE